MNKNFGIVVSKLNKTISVRVERKYTHPIYHKQLKRFKNYLTHDELNEAQIGDTVQIKTCRPISKRKAWSLDVILQKGVKE